VKLTRYLATLLVGVAAITACDNTTPPGNGDFTMTAANVSVEQGGSGKSAITIARGTAGDTSAIALTLEKADGTQLPTGITGTFAPASATTGGSELTISVTDAVAVQSYALRVKGVGKKTQTANLTLDVKAKAATFSLALNPTALSIEQAASKTTTVDITRTPTTDATPITLTLEKTDGTSAPVGITATFSASPAPGASSTATIAVGANVPTGAYALRIKGAAGTQVKTADLALTVTAKTTTADFTLAASPTTYSVNQGSSATGTINVTRTPTTDTTSLTLALEKSDGTAAPTGITAAFNPSAVTGASSTMTLAVATSVATGTYELRVKGTPSATLKTVAISLTVTPKPDFALSINPTTLSVEQAKSGSVTATLTRTNLATDVVVSLTGASGAALPAGITAANATAAGTGTTAALTIAVASTVAAQEYNLEVRGVNGTIVKTAPLKLTVTPAPLPINTGTFSIIKGADGAAIGAGSFLMAYNQDTVASYESAINASGAVTYTLPVAPTDKRQPVLNLVPATCTTGTLTATPNTVKGTTYNFGALLTGQTASGGLVLSSANIKVLAVGLEQAFVIWVDGDTTITGSCTSTKDNREYRYTAAASGLALKSGWNVIIAKVTSFGASPDTVSFELRGAQGIPAAFKWRYY
jgi:hypothetical protein